MSSYFEIEPWCHQGRSWRKSASKVTATSLLILFFLIARSQSNITRVEYYIDIDPGFGKATAVSITPATNIIDKVIAINPAGISEGVHRFYVRAMNASGAWSFTNSMLFYKPIANNALPPGPPASASNITKLEYYIDIDPGFGKATNVPITPGSDISNVIIPINPASISEGVHRFYVRARNASGAWSFTNSMLFYKPIANNALPPAPPAPAANITKLEYYIDTDPGFGKATNVPITPGTDIPNVIIPINPASISEGVHRFYVRALNASGAWSFTNSMLFYKPIANNALPPAPPAPAANITKLEYYIDTDPGFGKAKNVPITPGIDISDVIIPINPNSLSGGSHTFYVRSRNANGAWSFTNAFAFTTPMTGCSPDYEALKAFYRSTNGGAWTNKWDTTDCTVTGWYGVTKDSSDKVINLVLSSNNLSGSLAKEIGSLNNLLSIDLRNNQLSGFIPLEIGSLNNLLDLYLNNNQFSGPIPTELGALSKLEALFLFNNQFSGTIPSTIGSLSKLISLDLSNNQLSGIIPSALGNLSQLLGLGLGGNQLTGIIPSELGSLSHLFNLYLNNNQLTGSIPSELGNLTNLSILYLNNNQLSGCFPSSILQFCSDDVNTSGNPGLPGGGDFDAFCLNNSGECGVILPIITSVSPTQLCQGDTLAIFGTNFLDSVNSNIQLVKMKINEVHAIIVSASPTLIKAIFNESASGKLIISNGNGIDTSSETVTIQALPTVSAISNQTLCAGGNTIVFNFSGTGTSYSWTNNNSAIGLAASGTGNIASFMVQNSTSVQMVSTITVTPVNANGCKGTPTIFTVTVDPLLTTAPVISQNGSILSINFTPSGIGITGYQWMKDNGTIPGANSSTYLPTVNGSYTAVFTGICGIGPKSNAIHIVFPTGVTKGIYVDSSAISGLNNGTSWPNAYTQLQDALLTAKARDTILVAKGTYFADLGTGLINNDRSLSFIIPDSVLVFGGFPQGGSSPAFRNWVQNKTILSGEIQQDGLIANNSYHVVRTRQVSNATMLDGFEITSGNANNTTVPDNSGGGWYNDGSGTGLVSNPTIKNCVFIFNSAKQGGGLYNHGDNGGQASPVIINSKFLHNTALTGNGGALYNLSANSGQTSAQFTNCIFYGNQAKNGGAAFNNAVTGFNNVKFINCLLYSNYALEGAGTYSTGDPGACITTFTNSIIWAHKNSFANLKATVNVAYSITEATTGYTNGGNNKIGQNPFFVKINNDFHLQSKSPAINSGNNAANNLSIDLDGNPRIIHNTIDLGPFEYQAELLNQSLAETRSSSEESSIVLYQNIPNPFDHGTRIGILLTKEDRGILKITDLLGRTIKIHDQIWAKGYNEVILNRYELKGTGVYYYSFEGENFKAVKKMLLVQ